MSDQNVYENLPSDSWMVRPCAIYREEYDACGTVGGRLHQRYVFGKTLDCNTWWNDWKNCEKHMKTKHPKYLEPIIANEKRRREERLAGARKNDIWVYRQQPPAFWCKPLPYSTGTEKSLFREYDERSNFKTPSSH